MNNTILQINKFFSKNIAIIGNTCCGKTVLLQSLLEQAQDQGIKVVGIDWNWIGEASELGLWAARYSNGQRHLAADSLKEIPLTASPLIFDLEYSFDANALKLELSAWRDTIFQATSLSKSILCINEVDPWLNFSLGIDFIETVAVSENIQLILVSQSFDNFNTNILGNLSISFIGKIAYAQIPHLKETLDCPEPIIRECTKFASPSQQNYSSWLLAQDKNIPATERFQFYHHHVEQFAARSEVTCT